MSYLLRLFVLMTKLGARTLRPFDRLQHRGHRRLANFVDRHLCAEDSPLLEVDYDPLYRRYYVEADIEDVDYDTGHAAGKAALIVGFAPVLVAMMLMDPMEWVFETLGYEQNTIVALAWVGFVFVWIMFVISAMFHALQLGVSVQKKGVR